LIAKGGETGGTVKALWVILNKSPKDASQVVRVLMVFYKTILNRRRYKTVRTSKICAMFLGIIIIVFMIVSMVSAQVPDGWLKVKASFKGMDLYGAGKVSNTRSLYIHTQYDTNTSSYTVITCTPDSVDPNTYHPRTNPLPPVNVYTPSAQEQIWDFLDGLILSFTNGTFLYSTYPFVYMKTASNGTVSLSTLACPGYQQSSPTSVAEGSWTLKGKTIAPEKVPAAARFTCLQ
jgi:hypothetical protein